MCLLFPLYLPLFLFLPTPLPLSASISLSLFPCVSLSKIVPVYSRLSLHLFFSRPSTFPPLSSLLSLPLPLVLFHLLPLLMSIFVSSCSPFFSALFFFLSFFLLFLSHSYAFVLFFPILFLLPLHTYTLLSLLRSCRYVSRCPFTTIFLFLFPSAFSCLFFPLTQALAFILSVILLFLVLYF